MALKLFGHPISQPTRACSWLLSINKEPFDYIKVNPIAGETLTKEYLAKFPLGYAPAIEDGNPKFLNPNTQEPIRLAEAGAILPYLCETRKWDVWYPSSTANQADIIRRAKINEWLHWHHGALRRCTVDCFRVHMVKYMKKQNMKVVENEAFAPAVTLPEEPTKGLRKEDHSKFLAELEIAIKEMIGNARWTEGNEKDVFLAPGDAPTVADLMAYCELDQLDAIDDIAELKKKYPLFTRWIDNMKKIDQHDQVRKPLFKLADLMKKSGTLGVDVPPPFGVP